MQVMPAAVYESISTGPATLCAAAPVATKIPAPMIAPTPRPVSCTGPRIRRSLLSLSASSSRSFNDLVAKSWFSDTRGPPPGFNSVLGRRARYTDSRVYAIETAVVALLCHHRRRRTPRRKERVQDLGGLRDAGHPELRGARVREEVAGPVREVLEVVARVVGGVARAAVVHALQDVQLERQRAVGVGPLDHRRYLPPSRLLEVKAQRVPHDPVELQLGGGRLLDGRLRPRLEQDGPALAVRAVDRIRLHDPSEVRHDEPLGDGRREVLDERLHRRLEGLRHAVEEVEDVEDPEVLDRGGH